MNASPRREERARALGLRGLAAATATVVLAVSLVACGSSTASPRASGPAGSTELPPSSPGVAVTATPTAYADTLRVGWDPASAPFYDVRFATGPGGSFSMASLVYSAMYRLDARFGPVPDLADGPCTLRGDGTALRCRLIATTFQDGAPLTADDVAYTYRLWLSPNHPLAEWGVTGGLEEVRVIDPRTVDFVLSSVDPSFVTNVLASIPIFARRDAEAAEASFRASTQGLTSSELTGLADAIDEETGRDEPVCSVKRQDAAASVLDRIGIRLYREDFRGANGVVDPCAYLADATFFIRQAATAVAGTGVDAVAALPWLAGPEQRPNGTGPFRFVSESADRIHLEAWPGYHGGLAATAAVDLLRTAGDGADLQAGTLDILQLANLDAGMVATAAARGLVVARPPGTTYFGIFFNVRLGRLFADVALRKALQLCVNRERDVDVATSGSGTLVSSPVIPGSWAADPTLQPPERDVAAAKRLIEGAGWRLGDDGVYAKDGVRLAADIVVRAETPDRDRMADLVANEARDCGMELRASEVFIEQIKSMLDAYPHDVPGTTRPFDLYLGGWTTGPDPADAMSTYLSSHVSDPEHPDADNFGGFADPTYDGLIEAAGATFDLDRRAELYRRAQEVLAAQLPAIFLWSTGDETALRTAVTTADGPLDLSAPNWGWRPERLVVEANP